MAKRKRTCTWYLEPCGNPAWSNEVISKNIQDPTDALQNVLCADGEKRNLWRCKSGEVFKLDSSRANFGKGFQFKIFRQKGKGQIEDVTRWYRRNYENGKKKKRKETAR